MTVYAYKRVSTNETKQNTDRQLYGMTFDKEFIEYASGKNEKGRPVFQKLKSILKEGDTIWFNDLSRAGRNTKDLLATVEELMEKGVKVVFKSENLTFVNNEVDPMQGAISKMLLTMLASVNELFLTQNRVAIKQGLYRVKQEAPEKLSKQEGTKWHKTFKENHEKGLHKTSRVNTARQELSKQKATEVEKIIRLTRANNLEKGLTLCELADILNQEGIKTTKGLDWTESALSGFIKRQGIEYKRKNRNF